ncbi:P-loop ATPase, Sll1717 family [Paenibacillus periandrae]|uniref:P-loop ATPase, Sll1717 family n=1 Tax=Paenibacillus periandrae TaxID=1761741 RepID=UPI001F09A1B2|nr:hypothetical protein [Paenibacillus periandrae]
MKLAEALLNVDFGDIDGLYDGNIEKYFIDDGYWNKIVLKDTYYIIGRKGTGKSAIYNWIEKTAPENDAIVSNLSFSAFPFEKLLKLADDDFARPNQYQSIWRNIILTELASLIVKDAKSIKNDQYNELQQYIQFLFGEDLIDLHKQITTIAQKDAGGIKLSTGSLSYEESIARNLQLNQFDNITVINRRLENVIANYLLHYEEETRFLVQFDQLDDNYTQYQKYDEYYQSIISLFKVIYDINQKFKARNINAKVIGYLRSDIFYSIDEFDAESARWDTHKFNLNWSIVNKDDWSNPALLKVVNKRISTSEGLQNSEFKDIFNNDIIRYSTNDDSNDLFKHFIHRTFHRPRDIIQYCIKVQEEVQNTGRFYRGTINNSEKEYSLWLLSELTNEITVKIPAIKTLFEFLRLLGSRAFNLSTFKLQYKTYESRIGIESEELLRFLYKLAIIHNVNFVKGRYTEYFSIIRNDKSTFNRDLKIQIHPGFWKGLHTSNYVSRK